MSCTGGIEHSITLSNDGIVYSFGRNNFGQLGLENNNASVSIPSPIPNLPKIKEVSCGWSFTVCVDYEGTVWAFGQNSWGQLGIGITELCIQKPQIVENIPPVFSVDCGARHTLLITSDFNLWSSGNNSYGQLCFKNQRDQPPKFQKTSYTNISKVSCGSYHSLFQNSKGEIFSCGYNKNGELGLGHYNHPQLTPELIPSLPPNIRDFICGNTHSLFLDSDGNVFSVGNNINGQLGLELYSNTLNVMKKISNIPPIHTISCAGNSSYFIDFDGNLWCVGRNSILKNNNIPKKVENLKDIQQISLGTHGAHFLAKDSQNRIFVVGLNAQGQLGIGAQVATLNPKEMDPQYSTIWGESRANNRLKSARK